jgi:hypothetical protein
VISADGRHLCDGCRFVGALILVSAAANIAATKADLSSAATVFLPRMWLWFDLTRTPKYLGRTSWSSQEKLKTCMHFGCR